MSWAQAIPAIVQIGSQIGSQVMGLFGSKSSADSAQVSYNYSKLLQENQYELNRKTRQTFYQDTRQSLEEAGYNPLLALNQSNSNASYGASMNVTDPRTERLQNKLATLGAVSQAYSNSAQANLHNKNAFATVLNALNNTNQTNANVGLLNSQAQGQQIQNFIQNATGLQTAMATLKNIKAQTSNYHSQNLLNNAQIKVANATANLVSNQAQNVGYSNVVSSAQAQWYKNHPKLAQFGIGAQNFGTPVSNAVHSAKSAMSGLNSGNPFNGPQNVQNAVKVLGALIK